MKNKIDWIECYSIYDKIGPNWNSINIVTLYNIRYLSSINKCTS